MPSADGMMKVGRDVLGRRLQKVRTAKKTEPDVIAESGSKLAVGIDLAQVDKKLSLK